MPLLTMCAVWVPGLMQDTLKEIDFESLLNYFLYAKLIWFSWSICTGIPYIQWLPSRLNFNPLSICHSTRWLIQQSTSLSHNLKLSISWSPFIKYSKTLKSFYSYLSLNMWPYTTCSVACHSITYRDFSSSCMIYVILGSSD